MEIRPQPGPQEDFLACEADVAIYGGAAGGGKSYGLILEPLRHFDNPRFGGAIFRRTSPQLTGAGSLWEEAQGIYPYIGAKLRESPSLEVEFPAGGTLEFLHLQHAKTVHDHQGKQYAFIGFDELTHFEESQFWYMISRLRSVAGINPYMRCTTNPDPDHFVRRLIAWWIGDPDCSECQAGICRQFEHGFANPERSGVIRWFTRIGGSLYWGDSATELDELIQDRGLQPGVDAEVMSLTFIAASLDDNQALLAKDPGYKAKLMALPETERQRLLGGNWNARPEAGKYVKIEMFTNRWTSLDALPPLYHYTASDFAVTESDGNNRPDYTEHGVFGVDEDDYLYVLDWWHGQTTADVWIEVLLDKWLRWKPHKAFGEGGVIRQSIEPFLKRRMQERKVYCDIEWVTGPRATPGEGVGYADRSKRAKAIRGRAFQARASMEKIIFPASEPWADRVIQQCVGFPYGPDDAFDVMSQMCLGIDEAHGKRGPGVQPRRNRDRWADTFKKKAKGSWKTA